MYNALSEKAADYLIENHMGKKEYFRIYAYGFECFIATIGNIFIVLLTGLVLNMEKELVVYMIFYSILRTQSGGCHQASHVKCIITYIILAISSIQFLKWVYMTRFGLLLLIMFTFFSVLLVHRYAPIGSNNKAVTKEQWLLNKKRSRIIIIVESSIIGLALVLNLKLLSISALAAVMVQSMTLTPIFIKRVKGEK